MPRLEESPPPRNRPLTMIERIKAAPGELQKRYDTLSPRRKMMIWAFIIFQWAVIIAVIIITPTRIMGWFNSFGLRIREMGVGGWFLCTLLVVLASHPPLFGFAGSMSLIGFTYGIWPGFLIASIASMLGAGLAFLSVRAFFPKIKMGPKWDAFGQAMKHKGLPLIIMIRYSPIPWAIGNGLFASVESVKFWQFMLANFLLLPRLFIPVFIGSRLTSLIETPDEPHHDPLKFWLNLGSIILSISISTATGIWIYKLTLEQMRKLEEGELASRVLEEGLPVDSMYRDEMEMEIDEEELEDEPLTNRQGLRPQNGGLRRTSSSGGESY